MGIIRTLQAVTRKEALRPYILMLLFNLMPVPLADYPFVLLGRGGWSFDLFNFSNFIGQVSTNALLLIGVTKIGQWLKYNIILSANLALYAASFFICTTVIYSDKFDQTEYAVIYTGAQCLYNLSRNLIYITIIGRISKYLPEGFESTGMTLLIASYNISLTSGQYIASEILSYYNVKAGYYDRLEGPQVIALISTTLLTAVCPIFLPS